MPRRLSLVLMDLAVHGRDSCSRLGQSPVDSLREAIRQLRPQVPETDHAREDLDNFIAQFDEVLARRFQEP